MLARGDILVVYVGTGSRMHVVVEDDISGWNIFHSRCTPVEIIIGGSWSKLVSRVKLF